MKKTILSLSLLFLFASSFAGNDTEIVPTSKGEPKKIHGIVVRGKAKKTGPNTFECPGKGNCAVIGDDGTIVILRIMKDGGDEVLEEIRAKSYTITKKEDGTEVIDVERL